MAMLFIYNHHSGSFLCAEDLPPLSHSRLRARDFFGQHAALLGWTDMRLLRAYDAVCAEFGPIYVNFCFRRLGGAQYGGVFAGQSAHYAGLALDMAQDLSDARKAKLRRFCVRSPLFSYVEPAYLSPACVHAEVSIAPACGPHRGYPLLQAGSSGPHVFLLQDALLRCGINCLLTGHFTVGTRRALLQYQAQRGLRAHGLADAALWQQIIAEANLCDACKGGISFTPQVTP
ncbi:MAG: peptidoglycan-binding protein [Christensenellaceae bacterium]|jgi:hypothetical protein|nr:peptidoglycan-binding protein [Christensenellaceae bacterium]